MTYSRATGSENYRLLSVAGSGVLPDPECCRFRSVAGYRGICTHPSGQETSFKSSADNRFVGYRELPVPECCWFRNRSAAGYKKSTVPILTGKEPASNSVLTTGSTVSLLSEPTGLTGYRACLIAEKSC